jgi:hypothetical protein
MARTVGKYWIHLYVEPNNCSNYGIKIESRQCINNNPKLESEEDEMGVTREL